MILPTSFKAAVGNTILTTTRDRFHDETSTGALGTPSSGVKARVSYAANYYDRAHRLTATVNVGTNGGSAYTRPGTVPSRSDTVLVADYVYNAAGWVETTTDPKGLVGKRYYDLLGRTTKTIENYVNGTPSDADDKTVEYSYNGNGQMTTLKALLTSGHQETQWVYGITSPMVSNDVLQEMRYPDASTGNASGTEKDSYTVNQLGEALTTSDRNGSVHTYSRDIVGRQTADAVTTLGSGVDGAVRRIETSYNTQGLVHQITSYDAASSGSIVNQIERGYNGLGQMTVEYQAVNGAVSTSTTPKVQYGYSEMASGANHSRPTSVTYPNGRVLTFNYASGLANDISRLSSISDGATTLEGYDYLGLSTVVLRSLGNDIKNTLTEGVYDGGDQYTGLDRFGRRNSVWWNYSTDTAADYFDYGYDRNSNRLYKENVLSATNSELYAYDGLNQLTSFDRGTLNGTKTGLTGAAIRSQAWDFDALGNFDSQTTNGTAETRSHNKQNEITSVAGATTPTYDANGNLTTDETGQTSKYDAWNRQVEVKNSGGTTLATFEYDGLARRIQEVRSGTTTDLYYSSAWQVLEERVAGTTRLSYAWSPVYVDAMIARDRDSDNNGSLDERLYALHDANFNVTALADVSGAVVERYQYDPYGTPTYFDANFSSRGSSNYAWNYLHQGGRWDAAVGEYLFRYRGLRPTLGRWTTLDPIGFAGGDANWYGYVGNNTTTSVDPSGLTRRRIWIVFNRESDPVTLAALIGHIFTANMSDNILNENPLYYILFPSEANTTRHVIEAKDIEEAWDKMQKRGLLGKHDTIEFLEFVGHGSRASIGGGDGDKKQNGRGQSITMDDLIYPPKNAKAANRQDILRNLGYKFEVGAEVRISACSVAAGSDGKKFLQQLHKGFGQKGFITANDDCVAGCGIGKWHAVRYNYDTGESDVSVDDRWGSWPRLGRQLKGLEVRLGNYSRGDWFERGAWMMGPQYGLPVYLVRRIFY